MTTPEPGLEAPGGLVGSELRDAWPLLDPRREGRGLPAARSRGGRGLLPRRSTSSRRRSCWRGSRRPSARSGCASSPPDDAADLIQICPEEQRGAYLALLDEHARKEVVALLAYAEDAAGGLMSPRFVRVRPDMTRRRGDPLPAPPGARARRDHLLRLRARRRAAPARRRLLPGALRRAARPAGARRDAHRLRERARRSRPGEREPDHRRARPRGGARGRRGRPHAGHRDRRRHRRRGARGGHRGHPEDRRHGGPRRPLPPGRACSRWSASACPGSRCSSSGSSSRPRP